MVLCEVAHHARIAEQFAEVAIGQHKVEMVHLRSACKLPPGTPQHPRALFQYSVTRPRDRYCIATSD
jgi:hypothetical protein